MKKVLIPTKLDAVARDCLSQHGGYTVVQDEKTPLADLATAHPDTYALIVRSEKVTPDLIDALPRLKVVIRAGAGYNTIDIEYARKRGIDVMNTPGANSNAVAEEVVALMLADARHVIAADASCREGAWEKTKFMGRELTGKTMGIVGLGHIGRLTIRRLSGFDMTVLGYDPMVTADRADAMGAALVSLEELFERSDYISLHVPENAHTRGLVNAALLKRMKPGATLINCARSGVINEDDLRAVKREGNLRFLNDVYPKDEAGPKSVADIADIMLPHLGASTREANENAARMAAEILIDFDEKGITSFIVNRDIPEGLDEAFGELAHTLTALARGLLPAKGKVKLLETSVYGGLKPFSEWLVVPMACALCPDLDRSLDHKRVLNALREMGVSVVNRDVDDSKGYGDSITVDLTVETGDGNMQSVSVRGTVTEGQATVSRINEFRKLYFDPHGYTLVFTFADRPGVLGTIAAAVAEAGVNIDDVRNPHDSSGQNSIAVLKIGTAIDAATVQAIADKISARIAACVRIA